MPQEPLVRFDLLLDEFLEDGRLVVRNCSAFGHSGPDHTRLVLEGTFDIPLGTEFSTLVSRRCQRQGEEYLEEQVGIVKHLALRVIEIEFFRKLIDTIPCGHNAAVRFDGSGIELIHHRLIPKQKNIYHHLVVYDSEQSTEK